MDLASTMAKIQIHSRYRGLYRGRDHAIINPKHFPSKALRK